MATYWENSCSFGLRYVSWYKYLIVSLVFSHLGFWSGNLFLIAPFPDLCLLVPFYSHRSFIKIPFINKGIDFIDLPSIFQDKSVMQSIPTYFQNSEPPIICYKYNKPIRNTIFNFNKLVSDLDIHANTPKS